MALVNHTTREINAKIVYYGPGLCGKTTNIHLIYHRIAPNQRGKLISLATETDRTLFFDFLPVELGTIKNYKVRFHLYTVPGQVFYNATRKLVLKGADGVIFVVDSQRAMLDANLESLTNLRDNFAEQGVNLAEFPMVMQFNKRDLKNVLPVEELEAAFNARGVPSFQSVASDGTGVFETLRGITKLALSHIKTHVLGESPVAPAPAAPAQAPASARPPSADGALTLSDLPSVTDLLDMEGSGHAPAGAPLPDLDDDTGIFIEAPHLPEPPADDEALSFLSDEGPGRFDAEAFSAFQSEPSPSELRPSHPEPPAAWESDAPSPQSAPRPAVKPDPLAALASMKLEGKRPAARPRSADPKDAISSLLDELTHVGRQGAPSILRLEVPAEMDGQEIEIHVQLRHQGAVVAEGQILRPAPFKGSTAKLSVELKRS